MFWRESAKEKALRDFVLHGGKGYSRLNDVLPLPHRQPNFWQAPEEYVSKLVASKAKDEQIVGVMVEETLRMQRSLLGRMRFIIASRFAKFKNPLRGGV